MNWYQNLYIGQTALKRKHEIIEKIEQEQNMLMVYLITVAPDERNQLEIITPTVFYQQARRWGYPMIVGIALGMREAKTLLVQMTEDVYKATKTLNYRGFFQKREHCCKENVTAAAESEDSSCCGGSREGAEEVCYK